MLESIPCFFMTIIAATRVYRMHRTEQISSQSQSQQSMKESAGTEMSTTSKTAIRRQTLKDSISSPLEASPPNRPLSPLNSPFASPRSHSVAFSTRAVPSPVILTRSTDFSSFKFPSDSRDASPATPTYSRSRERAYAPSIASTSTSTPSIRHFNSSIPTHMSISSGPERFYSSQGHYDSDDEIKTVSSYPTRDPFAGRGFDLEPTKEVDDLDLDDLDDLPQQQAPVRWESMSILISFTLYVLFNDIFATEISRPQAEPMPTKAVPSILALIWRVIFFFL